MATNSIFIRSSCKVEHSLFAALYVSNWTILNAMEPPKRMSLNYLLKKVPIPSNRLYMKKLIEMAESVMKRMSWRAFFFLRSDDEEVE